MKKIIVSLVVAVALIGAVYGAAAGITLNPSNVDQVGSTGNVTVDAPAGVTVNDVAFTLNTADFSQIATTDVAIGSTTSTSCDVAVTLRDSGPSVLVSTNSTGEIVPSTITTPTSIATAASAADVTGVEVTITNCS